MIAILFKQVWLIMLLKTILWLTLKWTQHFLSSPPGPDSPSTPLKDESTHTRALKLKHQALEQSLEICLLELRKLCIREAVRGSSIPLDLDLDRCKYLYG